MDEMISSDRQILTMGPQTFSLSKISLYFLVICQIYGICCQNEALALDNGTLTKEEKKRVELFLHPLPQEFHISDSKYTINTKDYEVQYENSNIPAINDIVSDFKIRLKQRFDLGVTSKIENGSSKLIIRPMLTKALFGSGSDAGVKERADYVSSRPNSEQAYSIITVPKGNKVVIYIIANDMPGLYYGFLTFEQLVSSLSSSSAAILPHVDIVDWPDVRQRGSWSVLTHRGNDQNAIAEYSNTLESISKWKMNYVEAWHLYAGLESQRKSIRALWPYPKKVIKIGERFAVKVFPGTGHLGTRFQRPEIKQKYPDVIGIPPNPKLKSRSLCYSTPQTQQLLNEYINSIASQFDFAEIWLTELEGPRGVCHCKKCKGNSRVAFIKEIQHIVNGYKKAHKINPKFKIAIGLTQGSYPHNYAMLPYIPIEIPLNFYNGKMTYRAYFQEYNLPPSVMEMQRLGYTVGSTPSPIDTYMMFPFQTPQYCRLLAGEAEDRNLDFVLAQFYPTPIINNFNAQAYSEFLWNSSGRSADEFTLSWATRKGLPNPKKIAEVIEMLEYVSRGLHNIKAESIIDATAKYIEEYEHIGLLEKAKLGLQKIATGTIKPAVTQAVKETLGVSSNVYKQLEYGTHEETARILSICKEATVRAERLHYEELYKGAVLLTSWCTVLERYAFCVENKRDTEGTRKAVKEMILAITTLPAAHEEWLNCKKLSLKDRKVIEKHFNNALSLWRDILQKKQTDSKREER